MRLKAIMAGLAAVAAAFVPMETAVAQKPAVKLMTWPDLLSRPRPKATQTIQWGVGKTDVADLWVPDGAGPHPVVVMVHGGCWQKEVADRTIMDFAAEALRKEGMAVWNIEYRGVDEPGGGYPGTFQDVANAADALRGVAARYKLRTDKVAVFGHSAGGHLATWLAARPKLSASSPLASKDPLKVVGVVNSGGLADLKASAPVTGKDCLADIMDKLTGAPSATRANVLSDTSPAEMLPLGVRLVSVNGALDVIAPPVLGQGLTRRAKAAGDKAESVVIADSGHAELIAPGTKAFEAEVKILKEMLR